MQTNSHHYRSTDAIETLQSHMHFTKLTSEMLDGSHRQFYSTHLCAPSAAFTLLKS